MRQRDIKPCAICGKGVAQGGPVFVRMQIDRLILDINAINRQVGLEMMLGGSAFLAHAMGPDEDMAKVLEETTVLICGRCQMEPLKPFFWMTPAKDARVF